MNIQCYWDGNSGSVVYESRSKTYTSKMTIPDVTYDRLVYSEDDEVAVKAIGKTISNLTSEEIESIKQFADSEAQDQPLVPGDIEVHNSDPTAHPDIRQELSEIFEITDRVCYVGTHEAKISLTGSLTYTPSMVIADYGANSTDNGFVAPANENYRIDYRLNLSNITGYSGSGGTVTVEVMKNGTTPLFTLTENVTGDFSKEYTRTQVTLAEGDTISVKLTFNNMQGDAYLVPFRNFLAIANSGSKVAHNIGESYFNTLGNLMFYKGYELAIRPDDNNQPSAIAGTWASDLT